MMLLTPFLTLIERECARFMRLFRQTVVPPVVTTVLYILIFGYSLGRHINSIHGFDYITYIFPGLLQMGVITNAYANSSTSLFAARLEKSIENYLVAPLHSFQIVTGYMVGGLLRGIVVAMATAVSAFFLIKLPIAHPFIILLNLVLTSMFFSGLGIISGLLAESWDKIAVFTNFVLTPLVYLGGVFYSVDMLPPVFAKISHFNPIFYCVDLVRYGFLGHSDINPLVSLSIIGAFSLIIYAVCILLFMRGYKLMK
ncbi:ABC transporter permease [bacterium]|nr:ABC transporter permease [bacterium]